MLLLFLYVMTTKHVGTHDGVDEEHEREEGRMEEGSSKNTPV